jgi:putative Mn2+ efflux pump MntP
MRGGIVFGAEEAPPCRWGRGAEVSVVEVILLGVALSADAFAVTISNCFAYPCERRRRLYLMPLFFGFFQALMPVLGYFLGGVAAELIERYAGLVTLVILGFIGGNMIREGVYALRHPEEASCEEGRLTIAKLLFQSVATAIDAFAVGVSLRAMAVSLPFAVTTIGITTALCCCVALAIGRRLGQALGDRAEVVGGIVLVGIGIRAFLG